MSGDSLNLPGSDPGDEFSNNLLSDLAPLLALFGEQVAKQFMAESMGWADNIIFSMAPIGVITAVVSAIRIGGSTWLKALIGRAKENRAFAEAELMSSTSHEVCEMFNGQHVVRMMGVPAIKELIYIRPKTDTELARKTARGDPKLQGLRAPSGSMLRSRLEKARTWSARSKNSNGEGVFEGSHYRTNSTGSGNTGRIQIDNHHMVWTLEDAKEAKILVKEESRFFQNIMQKLKPKTVSPLKSRKTTTPVVADLESQGPSDVSKQPTESSHDEVVSVKSNDDTMVEAPPNISLNMHGRVGRGELRVVAFIGTVLQLSVLVFDWFITYHPGFKQKKGDRDMSPYAFPMTCLGTLILVSGMLVCCYIIESGTTENVYRADEADLHMLWLQQAGAVNDQMFDSYVLLAREKRNVVITSRRAKRYFWRDNEGDGNSLFAGTITVVGATVSVTGFILQFVGLRAMNWSASIAQFVATIIMLIFRAYVRRGLSGGPNWKQVPNGHEVDWLATRVAEDTNRLWGIFTGAEPPVPRWTLKWVLRKLRLSFGEPCSDTIDDDFWTQGCFDWGMSTVESFNGYKPLSCEDDGDIIEETRSMKVVEARIKLGKSTGWYGPTVERAICVASAIEAVMSAFPPQDPKILSLVWSIYDNKNSEIRFHIRRQHKDSPWKADIAEIEAVLSLWLFSVAKKESETRNSKLQDGIEGRISGMASKNHSLRLLTPVEYSAPKSLHWWLGSGMALVKKAIIPQSDKRQSSRRAGLEIGKAEGICDALDIELQLPYESTSEPSSNYLPQKVQFERHRIVGYNTKGSQSALAVISDAPLDVLYAQSLFSAFMWAFVQSPFLEGFRGLTTAKQRGDKIDPCSEDLFKSITLDNTELSRLVKTISAAGLGSVEEVMYSIFPPLVIEGKLPDMCAVVHLVREKGRTQESYKRWRRAGEVYVNVVKACNRFNHRRQERSIYEAACVLTEFIRRLGIEIEVTEEYRGSRYGLFTRQDRVEELGGLQKDMIEALVDHVSSDILEKIGGIYNRQRRLEGVSGWKPKGSVFARLRRRMFRDKIRIAPEYWTALHNAVASGDQPAVKEELRKNDSYPDPQDFAGLTPLHYARQYEIAKMLLSFGATVGSKGYDGFTPLHSAARAGDKPVVELLIEHGADLNARDTNRRTPLHWAAQEGQNEVVEHLIMKGADPQPSAEHDRRPLHMAACGGHEIAVQVLRNIGQVDINIEDSDGRTALHLAAAGNHDALVHTLADTHRGSWVVDRSGWTAIHLAAFMGHHMVLKAFLNPKPTTNNDDSSESLKAEIKNRLHLRCSNDRKTLLQTAVQGGVTSAVKVLLKAGVEREAKDVNGDTALMKAAYFQHYHLVKRLLKEGCDIESRNPKGETSLHYAAYGNEKGSPDATQILLFNKAQVDPKDTGQRTPLMRASAHGEYEIIKILLENKADICAKDCDGLTALHHAAYGDGKGSSEAVETLLSWHTEVDAKDSDGHTLLSWRTEVDPKDNDGHTPLMRASAHGELAVTKVLLDNNADIHEKDSEGCTALHLSAQSGSEEGFKLLLERGADVRAKDNEGYTALHKAAERGRLPILNILVMHSKVEVNTESNDEMTALDMATSAGHLDAVRLLIDSRAIVRVGSMTRKGTLDIAGDDEDIKQILRARRPK